MEWIRELWVGWCVGRYLKKLHRRAQNLERQSKETENRVQWRLSRLEESAAAFESRLSKAQQEVAHLEAINKKYETELEIIRDELTIAQDVTIPGLMSQCDRLIQKWKAESRIEVMRATAAQKQTEE